MPQAETAALQFLLSRRSRPVKLLHAPGPERPDIERMLTAAARVPDHGKLEPWRFIVMTGAGPARIARALRDRAAEAGADPEKAAGAFEQAPVTIAVVAVPRDVAKIPAIEQTLSAGAVALGLLNAALASGWGASWLTGLAAYDRGFLEGTLGLAAEEWIAGFVHIGSCDAPPPDRPRPDIAAIATWIEA